MTIPIRQTEEAPVENMNTPNNIVFVDLDGKGPGHSHVPGRHVGLIFAYYFTCWTCICLLYYMYKLVQFAMFQDGTLDLLCLDGTPDLYLPPILHVPACTLFPRRNYCTRTAHWTFICLLFYMYAACTLIAMFPDGTGRTYIVPFCIFYAYR